MKNLIKIILATSLLILSACGEDSTVSYENKSDRPKTQLEKGLSTQLDALEKSKQVEQQLKEAADKRRQEMRDQGI